MLLVYNVTSATVLVYCCRIPACAQQLNELNGLPALPLLLLEQLWSSTCTSQGGSHAAGR